MVGAGVGSNPDFSDYVYLAIDLGGLDSSYFINYNSLFYL